MPSVTTTSPSKRPYYRQQFRDFDGILSQLAAKLGGEPTRLEVMPRSRGVLVLGHRERMVGGVYVPHADILNWSPPHARRP